MPNDNQVNPQNRTWKLFIIALVCALIAGTGTMIYLKVLEHRLTKRLTPPAKTMTSVVVAKNDLPAGTKVNSESMAIRKVPAEYVNSDVVTPATFDAISGAILIKPLGHGKMLTEDYIDLNIPRDFSGTIKLGYRAVTIQVDEIKSISGMIRPGNSIDLYTRLASSTFPEKAGAGGDQERGKELVIPVLEEVLVLATDHSSARANEDEFRDYNPAQQRRTYDTLTLELTPKEAALLSIAEARGSLIAALRNPKDSQGILFAEISTNDLLNNSLQLLQDAVSKEHNRNLAGIHRDKDGRLVTRDGVVLKDQDLHLNKDGMLVTKDGTILSGRDLVMGPDGNLRTKDGDTIDTKTLIAGKDGTLIDKDGNVVASNGYKTLKGGFLQDKDGNILTPDGQRLTGVSVAPNGSVVSSDGTVLKAADLEVAADGTVLQKRQTLSGLHVTADGQVIDQNGTVIKPSELVTVDANGQVRTKDGKLIEGAYLDKDGVLRHKDGSLLTGKEIADMTDLSKITVSRDAHALAGVSAKPEPGLSRSILAAGSDRPKALISRYEVEYILGGSSNGAARTFRVPIEDSMAMPENDKATR